MLSEHLFYKLVIEFRELRRGIEKMRKLARTRQAKVIWAGLCLGLAVGAFLVTSRGASADLSGNPYPAGKSTYWAWQNRPELPANLGSPKDWASNAAAQGWPIGAYPRPGDVAVFQPGVLGADLA